MAVVEEQSRFNTIVAISLISTLLLVLLLPMAFAAGKDTTYSAYEDSSDAAQLSDARTTLGPIGGGIDEVQGQGYNIANTISTPMLVNDWKKPHLTMLLVVGPEKPIDETEAQAIFDFVTEEGGKVIVASDNSNANTLAGMFGLTYYDAPLYDSQHMYAVINEDGDEFLHPTNVWGLHSINKDESEMQDSEKSTGCTEQMIDNRILDSCRVPMMFRQPTGIKIGALETDDPESSNYVERDVNVLSYASKSAFVDIAGDGKEGTLENDAPGDIALTVRIDYPGIKASDLLRGAAGDAESGGIGDLTVTGSIVFVADDEVFANQYWTLARAMEAGLSDECTGQTCWQNELTGGDFWQGNHAFFHALIWDMMELDNNELANSITTQRDNFNIVFDESRHVTGVASQPFIETISTIVLLTSDDFLKWLIILNLGLLLLVSIMVVPEKANWRHVFDLTRFRERPTKLDSNEYRQRVQKALFAKVRVFYDLTRDQMALKTPAEVQQMIGDPRLVELAYSTTRTYSPQELRELLTSIRRWGKK